MIFFFASGTMSARRETGVHEHAVAGVGSASSTFAAGWTTSHDGQVEGLREGVVALVVAGHGHDRAVAVFGQHVVGDPDRDASRR
jgi:hypothetical protein